VTDILKILQDPVWQFIGVMFAGIGIIATIMIFFRQRSFKKIAFSIISDVQVASIERGVEESDGEVEIYFKTKNERKQIRDAHLLVIDVWNAGNKEIKKEDFDGNIIFDFGAPANILTTSILETTPPDVKGTVIPEIEMNTLQLKPFLLNKNDKVRIKVIVDGYQAGSLRVSSRIAGVDQIREVVNKEVTNKELKDINKDMKFSFFIVTLGIFVFFSLIFLTELIFAAIQAIFGINLFNVFNSSSYNSYITTTILLASILIVMIVVKIWGRKLRSKIQ
jgi:hypothetical protein